jgi:hypothetical protein
VTTGGPIVPLASRGAEGYLVTPVGAYREALVATYAWPFGGRVPWIDRPFRLSASAFGPAGLLLAGRLRIGRPRGAPLLTG